jgi:IclR family transcriptional regulator, acetate operon repressor
LTPDPDEKLVGADRVVAVLTQLAEHPQGVTLDELAMAVKSPKPTVHRALATLRRAGLADLVGRGVYVLGDEFLRLAFRNLDGRPENIRIQPLLEQLATTFGETAHFAILAGTDIIYRAKMDPPRGAVRLTSVVGGRNPAYRTAVGKALLNLTSISEIEEQLGPFPLEQKTPHTLVTAPALLAELQATRERGYAIDDQENEVGVNCLAIPVHLDGSTEPTGAISLSAVTFRCPVEKLVESVPAIRAAITEHLGPNALG